MRAYYGAMPAASGPPPRPRRVGRRQGESGTRDTILDAARDLFAAHGYEGASMRAIAARAEVDSGLIRHFFGDKPTLFATTMADRTVIPERMVAALSGPAETLGMRITDTYLRLWEEEETRPILLGLVRSAMTSQRAVDLLVDVTGGRVRAAAKLPALESATPTGLALASAHLFGVAVARNVLRTPVLAEMSRDELVAQLAPVIQAYLSGALSPSVGNRADVPPLR